MKTAVLSAASGTFKGGNYVGTLANGGVSLAPFHDFASTGACLAAGGAPADQHGHPERLDPDTDQEPGIRVKVPVAAVRRDAHRCHIGANGSKGSEGSTWNLS